MTTHSVATPEQPAQEMRPAVLRHIPALDGIRGIAIALVLLFHFGGGLRGAAADTTTLEQGYSRVVSAGWCGVDLFFVLSSFLITSVLYDAKDAPRYFRNFYMRRVLRIFPLYYGFLLVMLLVTFALAGGEEWHKLWDAGPWLLLYFQNFWIAAHDAWLPGQMNHLWSLAIEEQFYLVWPLVVLLCARRTIRRVCLGIVVGAFALRCGLTLGGVSEKIIYVLPFLRADAFAIGAFVATAYREEGDFRRLAGKAGPVGAASLIVIAGLIAGQGGYLAWSHPLTQTVGFTALALLYGALLTGAVALPRHTLLRWCAAAPLRQLGKYSYAVYVFHFPILMVMNHTVPRWYLTRVFGTGLSGRIAFLIAASAVSVLLAIVSWYAFETRFLRLKRHFVTRSRARGAAPEATPAGLPAVAIDAQSRVVAIEEARV